MSSRSGEEGVRGRGPKRPGSKYVLLAVLGAAALALLLYGGRQAAAYVPQFAHWVAAQGIWGPVVFILGYAVAVIVFVPGSVLTLAAGAIFGLAEGTAYAFLGATLGEALAFLVARYLARGPLERRISRHPQFAAIDRAVGREGLKIVALLRLSPFVPFNLLNYALGLTRVTFTRYLAASLAILPGTFLYVYYGAAAGGLAALAGGAKPKGGAGQIALLAVGLVATIAVTVYVTRLARRALQQELGEETASVAETDHA